MDGKKVKKSRGGKFSLFLLAVLLASFAYAATLVSALPSPPSTISASSQGSSASILSASLAVSGRNPPSILFASLDPLKVRPGDSMLVSAQISDPSGVSQVSALMPHELGSDLLNLSLSSGTVYNGSWRGS